MILAYETPICCEDFMQLVNSMGSAYPNYFTFHCDRCGKILVLGKEELDAFQETDANVGEGEA